MALVELARYHVGAFNAEGMLNDTRLMVRDDDGGIHHIVLRGKTAPTKAQVDSFKAVVEPQILARKAVAKAAQAEGGKVEP